MDWEIGKLWEKMLVIQQQLVPYHIKDILIPFFRGGKYTEDDARTVMIQILNVVAFCHLQGVVHRDLKPEVGYMPSGVVTCIHFIFMYTHLSVSCSEFSVFIKG